MASIEQIQHICQEASDAAVQKGNAQAKQWLRRQMSNHEVYSDPRSEERRECIDIELDGIWYTLFVRYGYKNAETWTISRNWQKSPKTEAEKQADLQAADAKRAQLNRMFK